MKAIWVWDGETLPKHEAEQCLGGKAATLSRLQQKGYPVPPFYVITAGAFRDLVADQLVQDSPVSHPSHATVAEATSIAESIAGLRRRIEQLPFPGELQRLVQRVHQQRFGVEATVAVRSSAVAEDASHQSFAGMYDTVLDVRTMVGVLEAIKQVWASAYSERALAYQRTHELAGSDLAMGVIVQQMIPARQSGVAFTSVPATDDPHDICVSAVFGCGRRLVSGQESGETFSIEKSSLRITPATVPACGALAGKPHVADTPVLNKAQLESIARTSISIEQLLHRPQDIEFCFDEAGSLFILQSRPITTARNFGPAAGNHLVWDNSNIVESYRGVTTPMTFSFIRRAYSIVYLSFGEVMGIPGRVIQENRQAYDNMLGLFHGRVYYNLNSWYRLVRLFPGYNYNRRFMESMMGVRESLTLEQDRSDPGFFRRWFIEAPALARLVVRSVTTFLRIEKIVSRFQQRFDTHYQRLSKTDFGEFAPHELLALYDEMEDALLRDWKAPIINDFFVMVFYGVLKHLSVAWCGDTEGTLHNALVCGEGQLESAEPARFMMRLAKIAREDARLGQVILEQPLSSLPNTIAADPGFHEFSGLVDQYLALYGLRCEGELKLEEQSWRDRPERLYQVLRNYLRRSDASSCDVDAVDRRERKTRAEAERTTFERLGRGVWQWPRTVIFRSVLKNARLGIRNRENLRFTRTRIYGVLREILRTIGRQWTEDRVLDDVQDIFYLSFEEVRDFVGGTAVSTDLRGLVRLRRAEYAKYRSGVSPVPDQRFHTYGTVYHGNTFQQNQTVEVDIPDQALQGTGCCPGIVRGTVQVVGSPLDDLDPQANIMVAESTDPGWVSLFPAFSGIVIERGSVLSHSAIVAREMGIPTVVGVSDATAILRTGQEVQLDGASGVVLVRDAERELLD